MEKLAINGGRPIRVKPWLGNITTGREERRSVLKVLQKGQLSLFEGSHKPELPFSFWGGPQVKRLEKVWAQYYGVKYAVSMNSATSGLYAAVGALSLGYGDEVIVSPYTMSACAACALVYGAIPIFADVELDTGCLSLESIKEKITPRTKAILVVHQFGIPAEMVKILKIAKKHNLKIIEDCAQAHGAKYKGRYVGTFGDIGIFSLNVNKTIQAGEGGVCLTNNRELAYRLALIRNHGEAVVGDADYKDILNIVGFNFRLTELQAAIGIEQLKKLNKFNKIRIGLVEYLNRNLIKFDCFITPQGRKDCYSTYYLYPLRYLSEKYNVKRDKIIHLMHAEGVEFSAGYTRPLYLQPLYQQKKAFKNGYPWSALENKNIKTNYFRGACPNAEKLHFEQMMINEYVRMPHNKSDMRDIIIAIEKIIASLERKYR